MKIESCKLNQLLADSMKFIILLTCLNTFLYLQGTYGNLYISSFTLFEFPLQIILKLMVIIGIAFILLIIYLLLKRNLNIRRHFIHLSLLGFILLIIFTIIIESIISIFIVYQINPQIVGINNVNQLINLVKPIIFIILQLDIILFPILIQSTRRKYFL